MRAIVAEAGIVKVQPERAAPVAAPGEAVVRPLRAAIAEPDLDAAFGSGSFGGVLGHQFVGVVEGVEARPGRDDRAWIGKRVTASPHVVCGRCERCRAGLAAHCASRTVMGLHARDGCLAERLVIPVVNLVEVPRGVPDDAAVFAEPLSRALHTAHILRVEGKPYVTVLGDGVDALLTAQVLARLNASVRLLGWQQDKFGLCERWGIRHRHADEVGRRQDQDIVVDCTGTPVAATLAFSLARPRAKVVLCSRGTSVPAPTPPAPGPDLSNVIAAELELLGASSGSIGEAVQALAGGRVETAPLVTAHAKLGDAPAAFARAREPRELRVLIDFETRPGHP